MKHIFTLFAAAVMAMTVCAGQLTIDLESAQGYASQGGTGTPNTVNDVLNVAWNVPVAWEVAGVEFVLDNITGVSKINFDYKGDGQSVDMIVYLVDANGGLKWDSSTGTFSLSVSDWTSKEFVPDAGLWGTDPIEPFVKLVIIANPSTPATGTFSLRNLTITCDGGDPEILRPEAAPAVPDHAEEDVMALYCNHYTNNNLNFNVLGWGDIKTWETLDLDGTNVLCCQDMKWEMMTNWDAPSYDLSTYEKFHFDVWVPEPRNLKVTFESLNKNDGGQDWKYGINFKLNAGWNTIDADPAWWNTDSVTYDWTDVKYVAFEGFKHTDNDDPEQCTSAEGTPFAFTNLYFWKAPAVVCPTPPADPKIAENLVTALFAHKFQTATVNFAPTSWGTAWVSPEGYENSYFYTASMGWDAFTNGDANHYDMNAYDMFSCDIWVEVDSKIKITFEALGAGEGGSGWKNGGEIDGLKANQWNHVTVDLLNAPYDAYDFKDLRYLILEGFVKADGTGSAEGTPLGITNAFFWNSVNAVETVNADKNVVKRLIDGHIVIEKNGTKYNMLGTQF